MSDTTADDLAAWLTQIWDEREALATGGDWGVRRGSNLWVETIRSPGIAPGIVASPQHVLARIAADRQILSRLRALEVESHEQWLDYADWIDGANSREHRERQHTEQEIAEIPGLVYALKCSALPHADRPGYQEAWRP